MIHSGSRNLGYKVCDYYNDLAIQLNAKWHTQVPKEWQLAYLPVDSNEGRAYLTEMNYCMEFAFASRKLMMNRIMEIIRCSMVKNGMVTIVDTEPMINIAHNFASLENHFGENVWIHRKGAIMARKNMIGIIPGSIGTSSYITIGKGNPESWMSCSHGAGRKMSRSEAVKTLNLEEEKKKLDDLGIIHGIRNQNDVQEADGSYKNIYDVMKNQEDLIEVLIELKTLAVIKDISKKRR